MNSLRSKITLALLVMSFIAIAVAGITSRTLMLARFDNLVISRAVSGFEHEMTQYYLAYGSWEAAVQNETFFEFVERLRPQALGPSEDSGNLPDGPPPEGEIPQRRDFEFGGTPPPFVVTDHAGVVLVPLAGFDVGDSVDTNFLGNAYPIIVESEEIGLAVPLERPVLSELEERYLSAIEDSWLLSLGLAALIAIPFGFILGNRLTVPVTDLTKAIQAMGRGDLNQEVPVRSKDELGVLSQGFNKMSSDLAQAHQALEASNEQISRQAIILEELSRQDELTGLMNRRAFDEEVEKVFKRSIRYDHPLSLALADIDHFKQVNDSFSHAVGDQVLRTIADLFQANVREVDLVARYGGEEFALAFPETSLEEASMLAERLRVTTQQYDWSQIHPDLEVTLSIGLSEKKDKKTFEAVLDSADMQLYEAKARGRNRTRY